MSAPPLLEVADLAIAFPDGRGGRMRAVDGVSFAVARGRALGIVGESGCGKSATALAIMRLLPRFAEVSGAVRLAGTDLAALPEPAMADLRGDRIAMVFQEPMTALNPARTVGDQIGEAVRRHQGLSPKAARARAIEMLARVKVPAPASRADAYPHQLSGGMRQRAMIAMALACDPDVLLADEPTTALDVTIQAQILDLIGELRAARGLAVALVTHDLGVVAETCDDVAVMYAGQVVEQAPAAALFAFPQHPYTVGLLGSLPRLGARRARLAAIEGAVPDLRRPPAGCRFAPRCPFADAQCRAEPPPLAVLGPGRLSRCWKAPLEALAA